MARKIENNFSLTPSLKVGTLSLDDIKQQWIIAGNFFQPEDHAKVKSICKERLNHAKNITARIRSPLDDEFTVTQGIYRFAIQVLR